MSKPTDTLAFPICAGQQVYAHGMMLRDWFAGQALAELRAAVRFLERVKFAETDEQRSIRANAWNRLEAAARRVVEIITPPAEGSET